MTEDEWKKAHDKWFAIVAHLSEVCRTPWNERDHYQIKQDQGKIWRSCSYCAEFGDDCATEFWEDQDGNEVFMRCPLEVVGACTNYGYNEESRRYRFWKYSDAFYEHRYAHAHIHAMAILRAIEYTKEIVTGRSVNDYLRDTGRGD